MVACDDFRCGENLRWRHVFCGWLPIPTKYKTLTRQKLSCSVHIYWRIWPKFAIPYPKKITWSMSDFPENRLRARRTFLWLYLKFTGVLWELYDIASWYSLCTGHTDSGANPPTAACTVSTCCSAAQWHTQQLAALLLLQHQAWRQCTSCPSVLSATCTEPYKVTARLLEHPRTVRPLLCPVTCVIIHVNNYVTTRSVL